MGLDIQSSLTQRHSKKLFSGFITAAEADQERARRQDEWERVRKPTGNIAKTWKHVSLGSSQGELGIWYPLTIRNHDEIP